MWTRFMDMHSGGGLKESPYQYIYIEAPEDEAKLIFQNRFGHNPERVSCTCCGQDYSTDESPSLAQATGFNRNCRSLETPKDANGRYSQITDPTFHEHYYLEQDELPPMPYKVSDSSPRGETISLNDYLQENTVLVIRATDIRSDEHIGTLKEQGYVWRD